MKLKRGFTTIELVTVIIIVGILAVNVLPRFDGTASYEAHTHRAQLISALRLTQQRAMQQTNTTYGYCHEIIFDDIEDRYDIPNRIDCTPNVPVFPLNWQADATGHIVDSRYQITFNIDGAANPQTVGFDWMGRPTGSCAGGCEINVVSSVETLKVFIEEEGYINVFTELH
jgi:MSHA pilin protein MshC